MAPRESGLGEEQRRTQLIEAAIEVVADRGHSGATLQRIADRARVTKPAVIYHFGSKDSLVQTARSRVLEALVEVVGAAVTLAEPAERPGAYVRSMVGYFREHPQHTRLIIEAMEAAGDRPESETRWAPLAELLAGVGSSTRDDRRGLAIIVGGAIDAIVIEQLSDRSFDGAAAADELALMTESALLR